MVKLGLNIGFPAFGGIPLSEGHFYNPFHASSHELTFQHQRNNLLSSLQISSGFCHFLSKTRMSNSQHMNLMQLSLRSQLQYEQI